MARRATAATEPTLFPDAGGSLPTRFRVEEGSKDPVTLVDTDTAREAEVPAASLDAVTRVLNSFFGEHERAAPFPAPSATGNDKVALLPSATPPGEAAIPAEAKASSARKAPNPSVAAKVAVDPRGKGKGKVSASARTADPSVPAGWDTRIAGEGYEMVYRADAETGRPGYVVRVGRKEIATVVEVAPGKLTVYPIDPDYNRTTHRNIMGVRSRLDVIV